MEDITIVIGRLWDALAEAEELARQRLATPASEAYKRVTQDELDEIGVSRRLLSEYESVPNTAKLLELRQSQIRRADLIQKAVRLLIGYDDD